MRRGGEPARRGDEAVAAPFGQRRAGAREPLREAAAALGEAGEPRLRRLAREPARQMGERQRARVEARPRPRMQRDARGVEALARRGEDRFARRQRARQRSQLGAAPLGEPQRRAGEPAGEIGERRQQFGAHRHAEFRRGGRRRRAQIGGVVDQRPVGLVADGGDERDVALRRRAHHDFLVEAPQVLERAAAARDDEQVGPRNCAVPAAAR